MDRQELLKQYPEVNLVQWNDETNVPIFISGKLGSAQAGQPEEIALGFLQNNVKLTGVEQPAEALHLQSVREGKLGKKHVLYQQYYMDVKVFGGEVRVHVKENGAVYALNGDIHPDIQLASVVPSLSQPGAIARAKQDLGPDVVYRWQNVQLPEDLRGEEAFNWRPEARLVIYPWKSSHQLAYHVQIAVDEPFPANWEYFINARTGAIINKYNSIHTSGKPVRHSATEPSSFMFSPQNGSGSSTFGGSLPLETYYYNGAYYLYDVVNPSLGSNDYIRTMTAGNGTSLPGSYITDSGNSFTSSWQEAGVDAHYGAGQVASYYYDTHGRYSFDDNGASITSTVHFDTNYNNAFWNGSQMVYGDGDGSTFIPLVSLDIVAHELTHAVTDYSGDMVYQDEPGALNEAVSDIFAIMVDRDDWKIGEDSYTPGTSGDALRYMDDPTKGDQPDHYSNRYTGSDDNGGVHINSGIVNKGAYLSIAGGTHYGVSVNGVGRTAIENVWYRALTIYFTSTTDFAGARSGTIQSAADLYGSGSSVYDAVADAWTAVGVDDGSGGGGGGGGQAQWYYEDVSADTPHPYPNYYDETVYYDKPGAQRVALHFSRFEFENQYDFVYIKDVNQTTQASYTGTKSAFWAVVDGDRIYVNTVTDYSVTDYGWHIDQAAYYSDQQLLQGERGTPAPPEEAAKIVAALSDDIVPGGKPATFTLHGSFPNPFSQSTTIRYDLPKATDVSLTIYDVLGRSVATLVNEKQPAGSHEARFEARNLPSGVYFFRLNAGDFQEVGRLTLIE